MIWRREQYIAHSNFEFTGQEMFCELFGPLVGLDQEWKLQGATSDELAMIGFDWDYVLKTMLAANCGAITDVTQTVLEENADHIISIDHLGRKVKLCKGSATIPLPIDYPVKDMDDWLRVKPWYEFSEDRIDVEALRRQKQLFGSGYLTLLQIPGAFDEPRELMGEEELCIACYEQPEVIEDMLRTISDTCLKVIERVKEIVPIDCLCIHEDMAGKSGPLFGPNQAQQFMRPFYRRLWSAAKDAGATIFSQDSDGNMNPIIDDMLDCNVTCLYPCEPAAGMDIVQLRQKYGKTFTIKGGIDKFALRDSRDAIRKELEYKMCSLTMGGGTIFALDHRIPNGVSIENYRFYVNYGREILGLPPVTNKGWERMAF